MNLLHSKKSAPIVPDDDWARRHPWGEQGSVDYWIEVMHRAFELGEVRAKGEADRLLELQGPQPPLSVTDFPNWFWNLWFNHLSPRNNVGDHPHRMPY